MPGASVVAECSAPQCTNAGGQDFLAADSWKWRGVCVSCNTRRMVEADADLVEHVFPAVAVRQRVLVFPKRVRYFEHRCRLPEAGGKKRDAGSATRHKI